MNEPNRILFVSQQIYPYLDQETPIRSLNRKLPEWFQSSGYETRTFMPKFGDINERRNQLHEVIRLSGLNIIISGSDHPLLIKVASKSISSIPSGIVICSSIVLVISLYILILSA